MRRLTPEGRKHASTSQSAGTVPRAHPAPSSGFRSARGRKALRSMAGSLVAFCAAADTPMLPWEPVKMQKSAPAPRLSPAGRGLAGCDSPSSWSPMKPDIAAADVPSSASEAAVMIAWTAWAAIERRPAAASPSEPRSNQAPDAAQPRRCQTSVATEGARDSAQSSVTQRRPHARATAAVVSVPLRDPADSRIAPPQA